MAYEVIISEPAENELDHTIGYIAITLAAPNAAASLIDEYETALRLLSDNPLLYGVDLYVSEAVGKQIRRCPVSNYGIYYTIDEELENVYIVAFAHGLRDVPRLLNNRL